jgi:hypothetical protein
MWWIGVAFTKKQNSEREIKIQVKNPNLLAFRRFDCITPLLSLIRGIIVLCLACIVLLVIVEKTACKHQSCERTNLLPKLQGKQMFDALRTYSNQTQSG